MYIDKIYTKLYSERNWNGLDRLVNEIKSFADYSGLGILEAAKKRKMRNDLAKDIINHRDNFIKDENGRHFYHSNSGKRHWSESYAPGYNPYYNDFTDWENQAREKIEDKFKSSKRPKMTLKEIFNDIDSRKALGQELGVTMRNTFKDLKKTTSDKLDKFKNKWSDFISRFKK